MSNENENATNSDLSTAVQQEGGLSTFNTLKETNADEVVRAMQNKRTLEIAESDEKVQEQIDENARNIIADTTKTIRHETQAKVNKSHFELTKSACKMYGYGEERPMWQQRMMAVGAAFWFIIYFIVATVTVCPISVFFDVFNNIFKRGWLAMLVAIIAYLAVTVGLPLISVAVAQLQN